MGQWKCEIKRGHKAIKELLLELRSLSQTYKEVYGVREKPETHDTHIFYSPCGGVCNQEAVKLENDIGNMHEWKITLANKHAVIADCKAAIAEAKKTIPVVDKCVTQEQRDKIDADWKELEERRAKERDEAVKKKEAEKPKQEEQVVVGDYTIREGTKPGYVEVLFPGKPSNDVLDELRNSGFRFTKYGGIPRWFGLRSSLPAKYDAPVQAKEPEPQPEPPVEEPQAVEPEPEPQVEVPSAPEPEQLIAITSMTTVDVPRTIKENIMDPESAYVATKTLALLKEFIPESATKKMKSNKKFGRQLLQQLLDKANDGVPHELRFIGFAKFADLFPDKVNRDCEEWAIFRDDKMQAYSFIGADDYVFLCETIKVEPFMISTNATHGQHPMFAVKNGKLAAVIGTWFAGGMTIHEHPKVDAWIKAHEPQKIVSLKVA